MKTFRLLIALTLLTGYISGLSSCTITFKTNKGKHSGWYKNPKNPHNPSHGNNGNGNGNSKGKGKKK